MIKATAELIERLIQREQSSASPGGRVLGDPMTLPNFLIIGAMRSGTTSLTRQLRDHPDVFISANKELHYFDFEFDKGPSWYEAHFDPATHQKAIGEATPNYMYFADAVDKIRESLPTVRMVAILRNPVDRAYSHYWHNRSTGRETLEFAEAILAERKRLAVTDPRERALWSYVDRGHYIRQLERVLENSDRERLLVLLFEDLAESPAKTYSNLWRFLEIEEIEPRANIDMPANRFVASRSRALRGIIMNSPKKLRPVLEVLNTKDKGTYPPMSTGVRRQLIEIFQESNQTLGAWLDRDLGAWSI